MSRSIYSLIHSNLRRMLAVTLGVSAVFILLYTAFSFKQSQNQAARFVMSHVERLAQAGVNSQDVNEIPLEIARFAETWKETQDLDLRIDIYLNERAISHAGQLLPFGRLSTLTEKKLQLASGDTLRVLIQMDLTGFILYAVLLLVVLEGAIVGLFYILSRSMQASVRAITQPLESKVEWLKKIALDLPQSARANASFKPANITEIDDLGASIGTLTRQIVALEDNLAQVNYDRGRLKTAEMVAHSIKGVIATLQLKIGRLPVESDTERQGLVDCITTLSDISGNLLKSKKQGADTGTQSAPQEPIHVLLPIRSAFHAKNEQYRGRSSVSIRLHGEGQALNRHASIPAASLQTVLFNLIDNSVEALGPKGGNVDIEIRSSAQELQISVRDDGRGIPEHILPELMTRELSYGKIDGNGVGLVHAKELIEAAFGKIAITSKEGVGTTVRVTLPLAQMDDDQVRAISMPKDSALICVDDDKLIHSIWKTRLQNLADKVSSVIHLNSVSEFENWIATNGPGTFGSRLYLFDFDLKDEKKTGLDLISDHGLALESILVSGMVGTPEVRKRTAKMGLRYLSKDFLDVVPIHIEERKEVYNASNHD